VVASTVWIGRRINETLGLQARSHEKASAFEVEQRHARRLPFPFLHDGVLLQNAAGGTAAEVASAIRENHYPLVKKLIETGRVVSVKIEAPANHLPEAARCDYRVTIRFKNSTLATTANPEEESLIKQL
jgi:hypothetical protein